MSPTYTMTTTYYEGEPDGIAIREGAQIVAELGLDDEDTARLFTAAPALLAALEILTTHAQETYPHFESDRGLRDITRALAAIARAEGTAT